MVSPASQLEDYSGFWIPTPMAEALKQRLEEWTQCGHTGGLIVGRARQGKTRAARAIGPRFTNRSGEPIRVFYAAYGKRDVETIRAVHFKVARALGFDTRRKSADQLLENIVMRLGEAALANETRRVVLIVDEAQFLTISQLSAFAEIFNELDGERVNAAFFFIANQDQFEPLGRTLLLDEYEYLRERFFSNLEQFFGIRSESELAACLASYDTYCVCQESKQTATEYFCPTLYGQGWRLASLASEYWRLYRERYGIPLGMTSLGMAQFVRVTNLLVMDYLPLCTDKANSTFLEACVIKSLAGAGIEPNLVKLLQTAHDD